MILVFGASGHVGSEVVAQLLDGGMQVRAASRDPAVFRWPSAAEAVGCDLGDPTSIAAALAGVDGVFLMTPVPPGELSHLVNFVAAAERAALSRVVFLSSVAAAEQDRDDAISRFHREAERILGESPLECTAVRPGMFMSNVITWWGEGIRGEARVRDPFGNAPFAPISERDVAAAAVAALRSPHPLAGDLTLTGPEVLRASDQVAILSDVLGCELELETLDGESALSSMRRLAGSGADLSGPPAAVTDTVERLTGRPPETFREWAQRHRSDLQPAASSG